METVATLDRVRESFDKSLLLGERPSASRIFAGSAGSTGTVLSHMKTILEEVASSNSVFDPARGLLQSSAETMAWSCGTRPFGYPNAVRESHPTVDHAAGRAFEEIGMAVAAEEAAVARADAAEARLLVFKKGISARRNVQE